MIPALETYKRLHGHLNVPHEFIIPLNDPQWPRATWKIYLGSKVNDLRAHKDELRAEQIQALDSMGFVWNTNELKWHHQVLPALREFKVRLGHLNVPHGFAIDKEDTSWPIHSRGIKLGRAVDCLRNSDAFAQVEGSRDHLTELGFDWKPRTTHWRDQLLPPSETFHKLHGHCDVPRSFVVPRESLWPPSTWNSRLGRTVASIRSHNTFKEQMAEDQEPWDRLGFRMRIRE